MEKYIKCFSQEKSDSLSKLGFTFLFEKQGVFWFENSFEKIENFSSNEEILKDTKITNTINL